MSLLSRTTGVAWVGRTGWSWTISPNSLAGWVTVGWNWRVRRAYRWWNGWRNMHVNLHASGPGDEGVSPKLTPDTSDRSWLLEFCSHLMRDVQFHPDLHRMCVWSISINHYSYTVNGPGVDTSESSSEGLGRASFSHSCHSNPSSSWPSSRLSMVEIVVQWEAVIISFWSLVNTCKQFES